MLERIDAFMPPHSPYQLLHYFTLQLVAALQRSNVQCRVLQAEHKNPKPFLEALFQDRPECTLSFNGLLPDAEGRFFSDLIKIPHVACLIDSPQHFLALTRSPLSIITTNDWDSSDFFEGMNFNRVLFMAPGVDVELINRATKHESTYDVIMLSTFIDVEEIKHFWKERLGPQLNEALNDAADILLSNQTVSTAQAFAQAIEAQLQKSSGFDPHKVDLIFALDQLERYVNGVDRIELVKAVDCAPVHIFGTGSKQWKHILGKDGGHVVAHEPVDFPKALQLMQQSKVVLASRACLKNGGDERVFSGIACGAYVVANENLYMRECFPGGAGVAFYRPKHWEKANEMVKELLRNEDQRKSMIEEGRELIKENHTWDHRAANLIIELGPILEKMKVFG